MNIIRQTGSHGLTPCNRDPSHIALHYTAGTSSKAGAARSNARWFANPRSGGTADFVVDDVEIVQYNPDPRKYYCWAVGGRKYNTKGGRLYGTVSNRDVISIEICSCNSTGKVTAAGGKEWYFTSAAVANAIELTKYLMAQYGIPADHVIRHYDVNGKICPGVPYWTEDYGPATEWQRFKAAIGAPATQAAPVPATAQVPQTAGSYQWEVTVPDLNIRKGPGTNYAKTGRYTGKGVFTITEVQNGWGRLKSGAGWISLNTAYGHAVSGSVPAQPTAAVSATPNISAEFRWCVTVPDLRIRETPGGTPTGKHTGKGTFTITETQNGWGRLKSGAGWISLDTAYGHRV